jgi:hypothetical protein
MGNKDRVLSFVRESPGCTSQEILSRTGITPIQQVNQILKKLRDEGCLKWERHGKAYRYYSLSSDAQIGPTPCHRPNQGKDILEDLTKENTLIVISCTKSKIWDKDPSQPTYVSAIDAYRGTSVTWLRNKVPEGRGFHCVILSAKYGFIEPEHPIAYYNVTFFKPNTGPISDISLKNQVCCQRRRFGTQKRRLCDFKYIFVKTGNRDKGINEASYLNKVKTAFADTDARDNVRKLDNNLWHRILRTVDP